jgi:hypothetical protein
MQKQRGKNWGAARAWSENVYVCLSNSTIGGDKCDPKSRERERNSESVLVVVVSSE